MRLLFVFVLNSICLSLFAQDAVWWENNVKWDGISHWSRYIRTQAAYMGPNALPVPKLSNGSIDSSFYFGLTGNFHFSNGDNTQNPALYANYCFAKNIVSIDGMWIPYEHFNMSHAVKTERNVFYLKYYQTHAPGDIILNTNIKLLNRFKGIQLALRIGYRFPTGGGLANARYTDAPGYYFDLSYGKPLGDSRLRWVGMVGFYSWQIISNSHRQDDAFHFGNGLEYANEKWRWQAYVAGYLGYLEHSGDKPIVARATAERREKRIGLFLGVQQGLHDFKYTSGEIGIKYYYDPK